MAEPTILERHSLATTPVEAHAAEESPRTLVGYAARFNEPVRPFLGWDEYTERLDPGALDQTLRDRPDVLALRNHDMNLVLGRVGNGTLRLAVDKVGLRFELALPDTTLGRDTYEDIRSGNINTCSIGFFVPDDGDKIEEDRTKGTITRTIYRMELIEITPACTLAANPNARVEARSALMGRVRHSRSPIASFDLPSILRRRRGR